MEPGVNVDALVMEFAEAHKLTPAQAQAVRHVVSGLSCKEAAVLAKVTADTVRCRRKDVYQAVGVDSCGKLTALVLKVPSVA